MSTPAANMRTLFQQMAQRPQDGKSLIDSFITAKNSVGGVMNFAAKTVSAVTNVIASANAAHQKNLSNIVKFITVKVLNDCLAMVRLHPQRVGMNEEIYRRFNAASVNAMQITQSLQQLVDTGGVSTQMEMDLVLTQMSAEIKSMLGAARAADNRLDVNIKGYDQMVNYYENQVTAAILKKLIDMTFNDVPAACAPISFLQSNRQKRMDNIRMIYMAGGRSDLVVTRYYNNLRDYIHRLPANRPFSEPFVVPSSGLGGMFAH